MFTDETTIAKLERGMNERGFLEADQMGGTFDWMRANDLVWSYVVNNWFMGRKPPAFDILTWNGDTTRMPAKMHSQYLRSCYLHNALVEPGAFVVDGTPIDLGTIARRSTCWARRATTSRPGARRTAPTQLVGGDDVKYTLSNAGHIAGIVNPVGGKKAWYRTKDRAVRGESADAWLASPQRHEGSWWEDWAAWAAAHAGRAGAAVRSAAGRGGAGPLRAQRDAPP